MNVAHSLFKQQMQDLCGVGDFYDRQIVNATAGDALVFDELLRWIWVQSVSALDKLVHDLVLAGMIECYRGVRTPVTKKMQDFSFPYKDISELHTLQEPDRISTLARAIVARNSIFSFQDPVKISDALALISDKSSKWDLIADKIGRLRSEDVQKKLRNIVVRRNQIAHQGDFLPQNQSRQAIKKVDAEDVRSFIEQIGDAIFEIVK